LEESTYREIPYNYTSTGDQEIVEMLLGESAWKGIMALRDQRETGRSARLLMRLIGDLFIYRRNPFLYQDLISSRRRRMRFFAIAQNDLFDIESKAKGNKDVISLVKICRDKLESLVKGAKRAPHYRNKLVRSFGKVIGENNVSFKPFDLVSHMTDATDWRLYAPFCILRPSRPEEIHQLLKVADHYNLKVIPRGAGTGLTGGAVPLERRCVIINTEKLNRIHGISEENFVVDSGEEVVASVLSLEAGVITDHAMKYASGRGLVFATDPTSAWASTIGGNLAENAGGKKAVRWGTAIDNVLSYRMAFPDGSIKTIRRTNHKLRKILPHDKVEYEVIKENGEIEKTISIMGNEIRKEGLWKDITNKALGGIPGQQKEGTDGVIVDAKFVLYKAYEVQKTLCMEFFGKDMDEACVVIEKINDSFPPGDEEALMALEHFDDEYMKAIDYKVKTICEEKPKAVLIIDVVGHNADQVDRGINKIDEILKSHQNTKVHVAKNAEEAELYWQDRKKLGAIAKRTNAFKTNEDIVLPIPSLAEFIRFCDEYNINENKNNLVKCFNSLIQILSKQELIKNFSIPGGRLELAKKICNEQLSKLELLEDQEEYIEHFHRHFKEAFSGHEEFVNKIWKVFKEERDRRIIIATHMHAGDGNVHVNIPVFSNDRIMMERADHAVDLVFKKVKELDGVVSGEHGIGITKFKYLDEDNVRELRDYRKKVDPKGMMNPKKLDDYDILKKVYTPSFNLLELEAHILKHNRLETLANMIAHCVRCGKCKDSCCTFFPAANMFYHPRNKNLSIGALIEALLYDAQREKTSSFELLKELEEIADHCTMCHKCAKPCPVDIDSGDVSVLEREILVQGNYKKTKMATAMTLGYLESTSQIVNSVFRRLVLRWGIRGQKFGHKVALPLQKFKRLRSFYPLRLVKSEMKLPSAKTLFDHLPKCEKGQTIMIPPKGDVTKTVFYFPGCGSERLFSDISLASIYLLLEEGVRIIIPPPFLCCGFPAYANAKTDSYNRIVLRNTIILNQIREMYKYLDFDAFLVTCGTCKESLHRMEVESIFNTSQKDVSAYLSERGFKTDGVGKNSLYHTPCHDSLEGKGMKVISSITDYQLKSTPDCCSESGTMPLSRPDISGCMLSRKKESIKKAKEEANLGKNTLILTNCPSCIQGLSRNKSEGVDVKHIVVELARKKTIKWKRELKKMLNKAEVINY
jgi:FAD/FMN-containing dehydrogenase/Fe-S oxidoreductase